jgi:hypothetical protein
VEGEYYGFNGKAQTNWLITGRIYGINAKDTN